MRVVRSLDDMLGGVSGGELYKAQAVGYVWSLIGDQYAGLIVVVICKNTTNALWQVIGFLNHDVVVCDPTNGRAVLSKDHNLVVTDSGCVQHTSGFHKVMQTQHLLQRLLLPTLRRKHERKTNPFSHHLIAVALLRDHLVCLDPC